MTIYTWNTTCFVLFLASSGNEWFLFLKNCPDKYKQYKYFKFDIIASSLRLTELRRKRTRFRFYANCICALLKLTLSSG